VSASQVFTREEAIRSLRSALQPMCGADRSMCDVAAEKGIFCRGFSQFDEKELRSKYDWITRRRPKMSRAELEEIADRWQLARQDVRHLPIACDVQQREGDMCRGWDDFNNEQLSQFLLQITGEKVIVI